MAKMNIYFDNKNYNVDEASLSAADSALHNHLSAVMNGSGAKIKLGGIAYNVDSTKLLNATSDFISHLGTISGNGMKVVVNGVAYNIDSTKMTDAISELEAVLGNLHIEDDSEVIIILDETDLEDGVLD